MLTLALTFWSGFAAAPDCASTDGSTVAGRACLCGNIECTATQFCVVDADIAEGLGECVTAAISNCAAVDGSVQATACKCFGSTSSKYCVGNNKCTVTNNVAAACVYDACANTDGNTAGDKACKCGTKDGCLVGTKCTSSGNTCPLTACTSTDGSAANAATCQCGTAVCDAGQKCTSSGNSCVWPDCAKMDGTATGAHCKCDGTHCYKDQYCVKDIPADVCFDSKPGIPLCTNTNGSKLHTTLCNCGGLLVETDEYCHYDGTTYTVKTASPLTACTRTNGSALTGENGCACGETTIISAATKGCDKDGAEVTAVAACADGTGKVTTATACACGKTGNAAAGQICTAASADVAGAVADAPTACTGANGSTKDAADCLCTAANATTGTVCANTEYCQADGTCSTQKKNTCADIKGAAAVVDGADTKDCLCGKKKVCAKETYCVAAADTGNGLCSAKGQCPKKTGYDPVDTANASCLCGDQGLVAAEKTYCLEIAGATANDASTFVVLSETNGKALVAARNAASTSTCEAGDFCSDSESCGKLANKDNCTDFCDDSDSAGSAVCLGSFVSTMASALNTM